VITEHTHSENNDWQGSGGDQVFASEASTAQPALDAPAHEDGQTTEASTHKADLPSTSGEEGRAAADDGEKAEASAEAVQAEPEVQAESSAGVDVPLASADVVTEEAIALSVESNLPNPLTDEDSLLFPLEVESPLSPGEDARPFTDFIEEFRQIEGQFGSLLVDSASSLAAFAPGAESIQEPVAFLENIPEELAQMVENAPVLLDGQMEQATSNPEPSTPLSLAEELPGLAQPRLSPERPVSPLLRPATRPRLPRHSRHRIEELIHPAEMRGEAGRTT
jgi:hypothetical protein